LRTLALLNPSFLTGDDWAEHDVIRLLDAAAALKAEPRTTPLLEGKVLALLFFDPSLRTRASFEVAMTREGGHTVVLEPGKGSWPIETRRGVVMDGDRVEHMVEAARVLGRQSDALGIRHLMLTARRSDHT